MQLLELTAEDREQYQRLVNSKGSFLQSWAWGDFQKSVGKDVRRFAIEEFKTFSFVAQAILSKQGKHAYLFLPYGPVLSDEHKFEEHFIFFAKELKKKYPELLFIRFEFQQKLAYLKSSEFVKSADLNPHRTLILDISKSEEDILKGMHPKTRYNIKVAKKHNVQVRIQNELGEAGKLFLDTAKRQKIKAFQEQYYQKILQFFAQSQLGVTAKLYTAWHEGDILAANLMIYTEHGLVNNLMIYLFGGSSDIKRNLMAPYALHWQAILDAKAFGYTQYDLWGYESDPKHPWHGFSKFKAGFGGVEHSSIGTYDYVYNHSWYHVYKLLRALNRKLK
ncbi:MAG: Methicillin resistance protein [Candidatus Doudnabacteria bacterium]|nr:Methicillin resistance protein [Candidatus Doudnabacteria bacterium]